MSNQLADVIVHVDETLALEQLKALEDHIHEIDGVVTACNREGKPHAIEVTYDPLRLKAGDILARVRKDGVHAELVGL